MDGVPTGNTWPRMTTGALDFLSPQFVNADQSANAQRGRAAIYGRVRVDLSLTGFSPRSFTSNPTANSACYHRSRGHSPQHYSVLYCRESSDEPRLLPVQARFRNRA